MKTVTVSIVTPSYNQEHFIEDTIRSILSQSGDFSLDYLIIDDGSTDASCAIIEQYEKLLNDGEWPVSCRGINYRWMTGPNKGQATVVNKGWSLAHGDIMGWVNSDDLLMPGAIERVVEAFSQNPESGVVYGNGHYIDEAGRPLRRFHTMPFDKALLEEICFILQPSVFFKRKVINDIGMLDESFYYAMDYDLWIRASRKYRFTYIDKDIAAARIHFSSKTMGGWKNAAREDMLLIKKHYGIANPPAVYRYAKASVLSRLKLPLPVAFPCILLLAFVMYIHLNRKLPLYPLHTWIRWLKTLHESNRDMLDIHLYRPDT